MTDSNYTAIALVVDRSGSMGAILADAQGGIDTFIQEQKEQDGRATLRIDEFDTYFENVFPSTDIQDVPAYKLQPRGMTALVDAFGRTIVEFGQELAALPEDERPGNVVVVVVTDGHENASREYTWEQVKAMVDRQESEFNWTFLFLAAGQDAIATGGNLGVAAANSLTYDVHNTGQTYAVASAAVTTLRGGGGFKGFSDKDRDAVK